MLQVMTDNVNFAQRKISEIIQDVYNRKDKALGKYSYNIKDDPLYDEAVLICKNNFIQKLLNNQKYPERVTQNENQTCL